jgi:hypothetical protein
MKLKLAIVALAAGLTALSGTRVVDSAELRVECHQEARRSIGGPQRIDVGLYRIVVARRQLYVRDCMANGSQDVEQTGSISVPLPPMRPPAG